MYIQNMSLECGWMCIYSRCVYGAFNPLTGEAVISRLGGVLVFKNLL